MSTVVIVLAVLATALALLGAGAYLFYRFGTRTVKTAKAVAGAFKS